MPPAYEDAKVHLDVLGEPREIDCKVRVGRTRVKELLPLARSLSASISAIAIEHARQGGKEVSCKKGCTFCCRQLIPVAPIEAKRLAEVVQAMPAKRAAEVRSKFAAARARLVSAGLLPSPTKKGSVALASAETEPAAAWDDVSRRYYALHIDCPFLDDGGACTIYEERPIACREYNAVTDPSLCERLDPAIEAVPRPLRLGEILTQAGNELAGATFSGVPLVLALEWAAAHGKALEREADGEAMFWALLRVMEDAGE